MKKTTLVAALLASLATGAHAEGYIAGAVGPSHASLDCAGTSNCDNSGTGYKLVGGFKINPNVGLEVSYFDFGKAKATIFDPGFGTINGTLRTQGLGIGVAGFLDFTPAVYGVARLGVASLKTKIDVSSGGLSGSDSESNAQAYLGLGAGYRLTPNISLDAALDLSRMEYGGEKANVRMLSVGATFKF